MIVFIVCHFYRISTKLFSVICVCQSVYSKEEGSQMTIINDVLDLTIHGPVDMFKHLFNLNLTLQGLPGHDLIHPSGISLAMPPPDMFILVHYEAGMVGKCIYYLNHSELSLLANVSGSEPQPGTMLGNTDGLNCHQIMERPMPMANC